MDEQKAVYEDMAFVFEALNCADSVVLCPEKLYFYRQVKTSLIHKENCSRIEKFLSTAQLLANDASRAGYPLEADIYILTRYIQAAYDNVDDGLAIIKGYRVIDVLMKIMLILSEQKSEKIKTCVKLLITRMRKN